MGAQLMRSRTMVLAGAKMVRATMAQGPATLAGTSWTDSMRTSPLMAYARAQMVRSRTMVLAGAKMVRATMAQGPATLARTSWTDSMWTSPLMAYARAQMVRPTMVRPA